MLVWDGTGLLHIGGYVSLDADAWRFDGATWARVATDLPGRDYGAAVWDVERQAVIVFGGLFGASRNDTWVGAGGAWSEALDPDLQPTARFGASLAVDPRRGAAVLVGGYDSGPIDETWEWKDSIWRRQSPATPLPPRLAHSSSFDGRGVLVFGGRLNTDPPVYLDDTWEWDGATWTEVGGGAAPTPRSDAALAYDPGRDRVVLFGGYGEAGRLDDTWEWDGATWAQRLPARAPAPRWGHTLAYEPRRGVCLLFGGASDDAYLDDTWEWDGAAWTELAPPLRPDGRVYAGLAASLARGRLVLFGGGPIFGPTAETWEWDGAWTEIAPEQAPLPRGNTAIAADPRGRGVLLFGGLFSTIRDDTWRFSYGAAAVDDACTGLDSDGDGLAGCADPDCAWRCHPLCPVGASGCAGFSPRCGDGACTAVESCTLCPADCGACERCGDLICDGAESAASCPGDCG
jgi:hypothetical protein